MQAVTDALSDASDIKYMVRDAPLAEEADLARVHGRPENLRLLQLVRAARTASRERVEDYVAAAAAAGPLMPVTAAR